MIRDFADLIAEVTVRTDRPDVAGRAAMLVGLAERALSKRLRLADMETVAALTTDAGGVAALPVDYEAMRTVDIAGVGTLKRLAPSAIDRGRRGYGVRGRVLISSFPTTEHRLTYYAALPSLVETDTNWLLQRDPDLYLQAVLLQVYVAEADIPKAQATAAYLDALIAAARAGDHDGRFAGTRIALGGVVP